MKTNDNQKRRPSLLFCSDMDRFATQTDTRSFFDHTEDQQKYDLCSALNTIAFNNPAGLFFLAELIRFSAKNKRRWMTVAYIVSELGGNLDWGDLEKLAKSSGVTPRNLSRWVNEANQLIPGLLIHSKKPKPKEKGRTR